MNGYRDCPSRDLLVSLEQNKSDYKMKSVDVSMKYKLINHKDDTHTMIRKVFQICNTLSVIIIISRLKILTLRNVTRPKKLTS